MAFLAKIKLLVGSPKAAVRMLLIGFSGFGFGGGCIFFAEYLQSEWVALLGLVLMLVFGVCALVGYLSVWYFRLFKS
jgi:hypothetical protein